MDKLRLLLWEECNKSCEKCANKNYDLDKLPVPKYYMDYSEIILTGGEPFLNTYKLINAISDIKMKTGARLYLHTALVPGLLQEFLMVFMMLSGITFTLHSIDDIDSFICLNNYLLRHKETTTFFHTRSLRLYLMEGVYDYMYRKYNPDLSLWDVKANIKWLDDCPLPENEEFMRYKKTNKE